MSTNTLRDPDVPTADDRQRSSLVTRGCPDSPSISKAGAPSRNCPDQ